MYASAVPGYHALQPETRPESVTSAQKAEYKGSISLLRSPAAHWQTDHFPRMNQQRRVAFFNTGSMWGVENSPLNMLHFYTLMQGSSEVLQERLAFFFFGKPEKPSTDAAGGNFLRYVLRIDHSGYFSSPDSVWLKTVAQGVIQRNRGEYCRPQKCTKK